MAKKSTTLYELCLNETAELLKSTYWNLNCDSYNNPFALLPSSIIDEIVVHITRLSVIKPLQSSDLHLLITSGRIRNFMLEDVSMNTEDLEYILMDLAASCENLISIRIKNVFCSHTYRMNLKTYALESLLIGAPKLESIESCIEFRMNVLINCVNLKKLSLHFPVDGNLFDFLEVDGKLLTHNCLRVLEVYEDARHPISYLDIAIVLRYCPELLEINCDVSKSLEYLHAEQLYNGSLEVVYKLQKCCLGSIYLDAKDATVSRDGVYIAALTCPDLREVDILVKDYSAIHALIDFHHLKSLLIQWEMMNEGDYHLGIGPLLEKSEFSHNLKSLHVMHFANVDFSSIGSCCPNLEELRVEFSSEGNHSAFPPTAFQKLTNLHVENIYEEDWDGASLAGLLSNATNLKYLTILPAGMLSDHVLEEIFKTNKLDKVKELRVSNCVLTIQGLQNLATNLIALEYFEMSSSEVSLDLVASVMHEINPQIILSATVSDS